MYTDDNLVCFDLMHRWHSRSLSGQVRRPYNLYCVGADVKPCSINQSINQVRSPRMRRRNVESAYFGFGFGFAAECG